MADSPALVFEHASVAYGRVPVLDDVHGLVRPGSAVALIGPGRPVVVGFGVGRNLSGDAAEDPDTRVAV